MNDETIPGALAAHIMQRLDEGDLRMNAADEDRRGMSAKLDTLIHGMAENTAITTTVKDALTTARVGRKVLVWLAGVVGAVGGMWGAWHTIFPHDITPK